MTITLDIWQLVGTAATTITFLIGFIFTLGKFLLAQLDNRLDARFKAQQALQQEVQLHIDAKFSVLEKSLTKNGEEAMRIERELMALKADLPNRYVRREDYIRNQSVIEAKIDGLALRFENTLLKRDTHG